MSIEGAIKGVGRGSAVATRGVGSISRHGAEMGSASRIGIPSVRTPDSSHVSGLFGKDFSPQKFGRHTPGEISRDTFRGRQEARGLHVAFKNTLEHPGSVARASSPEKAAKPSHIQTIRFSSPSEVNANQIATPNPFSKDTAQPHNESLKDMRVVAESPKTPDIIILPMNTTPKAPERNVVTTEISRAQSQRLKTELPSSVVKQIERKGAEVKKQTQAVEAQQVRKAVENLDTKEMTEIIGDRPKEQKKPSPSDIQAFTEAYVRQFVVPKAAPGNKERIQIVEGVPTEQTRDVNDGVQNLQRDGAIAAVDFRQDVEQALKVKYAHAAYMRSVGITDLSKIAEGEAMALRGLDEQLERTRTKEAVVTAYESGSEIPTPQESPSDIVKKLLYPETDVQTETQVSEEDTAAEETEVVTMTEPIVEEVVSTEDEAEMVVVPTTEVTTKVQEIGDEQATSSPTAQMTRQQALDILGDEIEEEVVKIVFEEDPHAMNARQTSVELATEEILRAYAVGPDTPSRPTGEQIVQLIPSTWMQPREIKSEIVIGNMDPDYSYNYFYRGVEEMGPVESVQEASQNAARLNHLHPAVRAREEHMTETRPVTEEDVQKVIHGNFAPHPKAA